MVNDGTLRLADLAEVAGTTRDAVRNMQNFQRTPWPEDGKPAGTHRRYDAGHALRIVLMEMLVAQGLTQATAAEDLQSQSFVIDRFVAAQDAHRQIAPLFVYSLRVAHEDTWTGPRWTPTVGGTGTAEEILDFVRFAFDRTGHERPDEDHPDRVTRQIGGPWLAVAPLAEAWRLLRYRARRAGYAIDGRRIVRVTTEPGRDRATEIGIDPANIGDEDEA